MASLYSAGRARLAEPALTDAANHRERRPQLVRRVGGKAAQLVERRLQPRERVVDHGGQPADFVVLIRHRQRARAGVRR